MSFATLMARAEGRRQIAYAHEVIQLHSWLASPDRTLDELAAALSDIPAITWLRPEDAEVLVQKARTQLADWVRNWSRHSVAELRHALTILPSLNLPPAMAKRLALRGGWGMAQMEQQMRLRANEAMAAPQPPVISIAQTLLSPPKEANDE